MFGDKTTRQERVGNQRGWTSGELAVAVIFSVMLGLLVIRIIFTVV